MASRTAACSCVFAALASFATPYKVFGNATEYLRVGYDKSVSVAVGAFADPQFPAPRVSVYDCRRHSWVHLPEGITKFEIDPP